MILIWNWRKVKIQNVCLGGFFWVVFLSTQEFSNHLETSPLSMKGYKFWPLLGTHGHWAGRVLWRTTPIVTRTTPSTWPSPRTPDTYIWFPAFGSGSFFKDLGLSRPRIEPRPPASEANALPLRNRGGNTEYKLYNMKNIFQIIQSGFVIFFS